MKFVGPPLQMFHVSRSSNGTRETLNRACVARLPCAVLGLCAYG